MNKFRRDIVSKMLEVLSFTKEENCNKHHTTITYSKQDLKIRIGSQNIEITKDSSTEKFAQVISVTEFISLVTNVPLLYDLLRSYNSASSATRDKELKEAYEKGFKAGYETP